MTQSARDGGAALSHGETSTRVRELVGKERAMWLFHQFAPEIGILNVAFAYEFAGGVDIAALDRAFAHLVRRHSALRTLFPVVDGTPVRATLAADDPAAIPRVTVRRAPPASLTEAYADAARRAFDVESELPIRVEVVRVDPGPADDVVVVTANHLVYDAFSAAVVERELLAAYRAFASGAELPAWLRGEVIAPDLRDGSEEGRRYWQHELDGVRPSPDLTLGNRGPRRATFPGATVRRRLDPAAWEALRTIAKRTSCLPSAVALAAVATVLSRHGAGDDIVFGVPTYNRGSPPHEAVGYYTIIEPIRVRPAPDLTFDRLVRQCAERMLEGLRHADVALDDVAPDAYQAGADGRPLVRYLFNYVVDLPVSTDGAGGADAGSDRPARLVPLSAPTSRMDLDLALSRDGDGVALRAIYAADLFEERDIDTLLARVEVVLRAAADAGAESPAASVSTVAVRTPHDRAVASAAVPAELDTAAAATVLDDLAASAFAAPDQPALLDPVDGPMSFGDLLASAETVAEQLRGERLPAGSVVAVSTPSVPATAIAVVGCWLAGCAAWVAPPSRPAGASPDVRATVSAVALRRGSGALPLAGAHADDPAVVWLDGGTAWSVSHGALALGVTDLVAALGLAAGDVVAAPGRWLVDGPGLLDALAAWRAGATVLPMSGADDDAARAACDAGATVIVTSGLVASRLVDRMPAGAGRDLRVLVRRGRPAADLAARAAAAGVSVVRVLAQPAAGGLAAVGPLVEGRADVTYGRPVAGVRVVDAAGADVLPGCRGTLLVDPARRAVPLDGAATSAEVRLGLDGLVEAVDETPVDDDGLPAAPDGAAGATADETASAPETTATDASETVVDVLELWRRLLGRDDVGPDDNFFTCGGDSLLAARVIGHIKKTTGKGISLRTLFTAPTPVAFASALESAGVTRLRPAEAG